MLSRIKKSVDKEVSIKLPDAYRAQVLASSSEFSVTLAELDTEAYKREHERLRVQGIPTAYEFINWEEVAPSFLDELRAKIEELINYYRVDVKNDEFTGYEVADSLSTLLDTLEER